MWLKLYYKHSWIVVLEPAEDRSLLPQAIDWCVDIVPRTHNKKHVIAASWKTSFSKRLKSISQNKLWK